MEIVQRQSGKVEVWIGKRERRFGKYEISGLLKLIGILLLMIFSFILGAIIF